MGPHVAPRASVGRLTDGGQGMMERQLISVVVPLYNEEGNIRKLHQELKATLDQLWYDFEIIFVDDGSTDQTLAVLESLSVSDRRVKLVSLSRNFGTQLAILAGLDHARGDAVIVMDGDLQHPPMLIPEMIARWEEGYEVVYAIRKRSNGAGFLKRLGSSAFSSLLGRLFPSDTARAASDFRLLDRTVVDALVQMRERHRFFRSLVTWAGFRQSGLPFVAAERHSGETKYGLCKLTSLAIDAIISSSIRPLRLCTYLGLIAAFSGFPYALWAIYVRLFTNRYIPGWSAIIVAILFLGGVQLICLGILGEYVGRIYEEVRGRPSYLVRARHGFRAESRADAVGDEQFANDVMEESQENGGASVSRPIAQRDARLR